MTAVGDFYLSNSIVFQKADSELRGKLKCNISEYDYFIMYIDYHKNSYGKTIRKYCLWVDSQIDGMMVCFNTCTFDQLNYSDVGIMRVERE